MVPKIGVVVPSGDTWQARFAVCLVSLIQYSSDKFEIVLINPRSSLIATGRQMGVDEAVRRRCDAILFLDSDMVFPHTLLEELYQSEHHGVVGASYVKRAPPVSWNHVELSGSPELGYGVREVRRLPLGATLIRADVFATMERPYFRCGYENGIEIGEDFYFCDQVRKLGGGVWMDAAASAKIGHLGSHTFTYKGDIPNGQHV